MQRTNLAIHGALLGAALLLPACEGRRQEATAPAPATPPAAAPAPTTGRDSAAAEALKGGAAYEVAEVSRPGALAVTAVFTGDPIPQPAEVPVNINVDFCGHKVFTESVLVDKETRGLKHVVVRLEGITRGKAPPASITITNRNCAFDPHVAVAMKGTRIAIANADPVLHNTHPYINGSSFFNLALAPGSEPPPARPIPKTGLMEINCDVHKWMRSFVFVHTSPYVEATDKSGKLRIDGIPPGKHAYVAWHEELGEKKGEVEIAPDGTAELKLEFAPQK